MLQLEEKDLSDSPLFRPQREADAAIFDQEMGEYMGVSDKTAHQTDEQHAQEIDKLGQKRKSASDTSQLESPANKKHAREKNY